jgi:hypothetical protein
VLVERFGFVADGDRMALGTQRLMLLDEAAPRSHVKAIPFDHLAMSVANVDDVHGELKQRGLELSAAFTPDGPREIAEFWDHGVRFVFFDGPDGAPFEFCEVKNAPSPDHGFGHGHFGLRTIQMSETVAQLEAMGAVVVATYRLGSGLDVVNVVFLRLGDAVFEVFDEKPAASLAPQRWIGFVDER